MLVTFEAGRVETFYAGGERVGRNYWTFDYAESG